MSLPEEPDRLALADRRGDARLAVGAHVESCS